MEFLEKAPLFENVSELHMPDNIVNSASGVERTM